MNSKLDEQQGLFSTEEYELHFKQIENIKKEIEQMDQDIISQKSDLSTLEIEYSDNLGFFIKILRIKEQFPKFRRVRRDGSCFYRGLLFRIMEEIIEKKRQDILTKFITLVKKSKGDLLTVGYDELVIDDFQSLLIEKLELCPNKITLEEMKNVFCDRMSSDYLIMYMRMMTSGFIKNNSFMFEGYIETETVDQFCQQEVDPYDREADQIQIMALINYLDIPIKIYYLDGNVNVQEATVFKIPEDTNDEEVFINLLYRPGHYDILYRN